MIDKKSDWNELILEYDSEYHALTDWRLGYSIIEDMLGNVNEKNILDYGCGTGKFSRRLNYLGAKVIGVDISERAIKTAKIKSSKEINYRLIKKPHLFFIPDNSLDVVVINFVFCCVQKKEKIIEILKEIRKKIKEDEQLIILDPHPFSVGNHYVSFIREKPERLVSGIPIKVRLSGMNKSFYDYWRSKEDYIDILESAGFVIKEIKEPLIQSHNKEKFWKDERKYPPLIIIKSIKSIKGLRKKIFKGNILT